MYLDLMPGKGLDALIRLVNTAKEQLASAGIESTDDREFTPHVTIAKMSKVRTRRRGKKPVCKGIPKVISCQYNASVSFYSPLDQYEACRQPAVQHLCAMAGLAFALKRLACNTSRALQGVSLASVDLHSSAETQRHHTETLILSSKCNIIWCNNEWPSSLQSYQAARLIFSPVLLEVETVINTAAHQQAATTMMRCFRTGQYCVAGQPPLCF